MDNRGQRGILNIAQMLGVWAVLAATPFVAWYLHPVAPKPPQSIQGSYGTPVGNCTAPLINIDASNSKLYICVGAVGDPSGVWVRAIPAGTTVMTLNSACGAGWTEVSALSGKFALGTVAANSDVGTTGGAATQTFTTAGNVSLLGIGTALTGPSSINLSPPYAKVIFCQLP